MFASVVFLLLLFLALRLIPRRSPPSGPRITRLDNAGITVGGLDATWSDVEQIVTYKRDFLAYDMVCIALNLRHSRCIEVWEEDPQFASMTTELERRFSSIPEGWLDQVCQPAFETNYRVLWRLE